MTAEQTAEIDFTLKQNNRFAIFIKITHASNIFKSIFDLIGISRYIFTLQNLFFVVIREEEVPTFSMMDHVIEPTLITERVPHSRAIDILTHPDNQWKLFPHGYFLINWDPFKVLPSNFHLVLQSTSAHLATFGVGGSENSCVAFSIGNANNTPKSCIYQIDFFGTDEHVLMHHLRHHAKIAVQKYTSGRMRFLLHISNKLDENLVRKLLYDTIPGEPRITSTMVYHGRFPLLPELATAKL